MALNVTGIILPAMASAGPSSIQVTTTADSGDGSLRQAIADASSGDTITFASTVSGSIDLESSLVVDKDLTILGPGAGKLSVDGGDAHADLVMDNGGGDVTITNLTFTHGHGGDGGGISDESGGNLTLYGVRVVDNVADDEGGGIATSGAQSLTVTASTISGNSAALGGGIYATLPSESSLSILRSTISGNDATGGTGNAIDVTGIPTESTETTYQCDTGHLTGTNRCIFEATYDYQAAGYSCAYGFGPYSDGGDAYCYYDAYLVGRSYQCDKGHGGTLHGNECHIPATYNETSYFDCPGGAPVYYAEYNNYPYGYGEYCETDATAIPGTSEPAGVLTIQDSTIADNGSGDFYDSGINLYNTDSNSSIRSATISGNAGVGLGMRNDSDYAVSVGATLLSNGSYDCWKPDGNDGIKDLGYNLAGSYSCPWTEDSSISGASIDGALSPLADNGGPTKTVAISGTDDPAHAVIPADFTLPDAPAPVCSTRDQRRALPAGAPCDIGAFQREAAPKIIGEIHSPKPKTAYGWYGSSVRINFRCHAGDYHAPITDCTDDAHLTDSGKHQSATGTATAIDGRTTSITVKHINIDKDDPTIHGINDGKTYDTKPAISCADGLSGIDSCTVHRHHKAHHVVHYTVTAVDKAGNRTTEHGNYTLAT